MIRAIRRRVFVEEQGIPEALEMDGRDDDCRHVLAFSRPGTAVGTGRLQPDGRIGRMAVLADWRRHGAGTEILAALMRLAGADGHRRVVLHAQRSVAGFYRKSGFVETGAAFMEAGIAHVPMEKELPVDNT